MPATKQKSGAPNAFETSMKFWRELPSAFGKTALQTWTEMGSEAVRFVSDRMQQDIKTQQAMLACKSLEELRKVQAEFFKSAQDQYAAEAKKMLELMHAAAGNIGAPKGRGYDDVPL